MKHLILTTIIVLSAFVTSFGQNVMPSDYKADQVLKSNARVNPTSLAMELSIPVGGYKGRAGNGIPIAFSYSSKVWQMETTFGGPFEFMSGVKTALQPTYAKRTAAGWSSTVGSPRIDFPSNVYEADHYGSQYTGQLYQPVECTNNCSNENFNLYYVKRVQVTMPDGSSHEFRKDDTLHSYGTRSINGTQDMTGTFLSVDGSRMRLDITSGSATLFLPDGGRYIWNYSPGSGGTANEFFDRHGNKMSFNISTRVWTDTIGRTIADPFPDNWASQNQIVETVESTFPGVGSETLDVSYEWVYLKDPSTSASVIDDPDNTSQTLSYSSNAYCSNGGSIAHYYRSGSDWLFSNPEVSMIWVCSQQSTKFNPIVLKSIDLPNGQSYQFRYNAFGEMTKIIYPTGGYERFKYAMVGSVQPNGLDSYDQTNRGVIDRWISEKGDGTDEIHWEYDETGGVTNAPDGTRTEQSIYTEAPGTPQPFGFGDAKTGRPFEERSYNSSNQLMSRKLTIYETTGSLSGGYAGATRDMRPVKEITILFEYGNSNALATMTETVYDTADTIGSTDPAYFSSLNPKQQKTYHYKSVAATTATTANLTDAANWFSSETPASITEMDYLYDANYKARNINGLVSATRVLDPASPITVKAKTEISYDEVSTYPLLTDVSSSYWTDPSSNYRGLVTTTKSWTDITNNLSIQTHAQYDRLGNIRKSWDGNGNLSQIEYSSTYDYAYPTKTISPIPDSSGTYGLNDELETTVTYDFDTALPLTTTDPNGAVTTMEYDDPLFRATKVTTGYGTAIAVESITEYGAGTSASTRWVKAKGQIDSANWKEGLSWFDGFGRGIRSQSVDAESGDVFTMTCYDNMGRVSKATNPFRDYSAQTCSTTTGLEWTTNTYDTAGRPWKVTTPDGAIVETTYGLASTSGYLLGSVVTVEDQADKLRRSVTNALGQLKRVDEPNSSNVLGALTAPNQDTTYAYDYLNNLTTVTQGAQTRTFAYDGLSRLKTAVNPESGTINYTYDSNGNLATKVDARSITTSYAYDRLNRVTQRSYAMPSPTPSPSQYQNSPTVTYYYDNLTNAKGKLKKVTSSISTTEYTSFDILGRVTGHKQTTDGNDYTTEYVYNLGGAMIEQTYPSTRKVQYSLDASGDLASVQSKENSSAIYKTYANDFTYTAAGAVSSLKLGNGKFESTTFNTRLQPTQIALGHSEADTSLLKLVYGYGTTANNGNVLTQDITVKRPGTSDLVFNQTYTYDELNRLKIAEEKTGSTTNWKQTFTFDRYGNRRFDESNTTVPSSFSNQALTNPTISTSNNRLTSTGWSYDSSGNTTGDPDGRTFTYDGENKQIEVKNSSNASIGTYFFDGDGKRVKKEVPTTGETTIFVYDAGGKLVAEYSTVVQSSSNAKVQYLTNDNLGTPRFNTDANGSITSRSDYMPYGEEIVSLGGRASTEKYVADDVRQGFTGYENDGETGLDFAQARMYANKFGRFTSVDPIFIKPERLTDPQRINLYIYSRNNPLKFIDPTGEDIVLKDGMSQKQLDQLVDALYAAYETEQGKQFFDGEASADTTLTLAVGDVADIDDTAFAETAADTLGNITITVDLDARDKTNKIADDQFKKQGPPSSGINSTYSKSKETTIVVAPGLKEIGKHEVSHGIDARKDIKKYNEDAKKDSTVTPSKNRVTEQRREAIQKDLVKRKDIPKGDKEKFKKLIGYDQYKVRQDEKKKE